MSRPALKKRDDLWFTDRLSPNEVHHHRLRRILVERKTRFQDALIADSFDHGRLLVLDNELQSAERDEHIYHEALVHPAMTAHPAPADVLILGGGEGATAREVLRHRTVTSLVMVDIDAELLDFCRRTLPTWHCGSFDDPRTEVEIGDAGAFVAASGRKFDIILSDLPTPAGAGPLRRLYSVSFFRKLARMLKPGGLLATQSGPASAADATFHRRVGGSLAQAFRRVHPYSAHVPSFGLPWGFTLAGSADPSTRGAREIDARLKRRGVGGLRFYDGETHAGLFHIPKPLRIPVRRLRKHHGTR